MGILIYFLLFFIALYIDNLNYREMTIDELFSLPINEMKDWMTENFKIKQAYEYKYNYWYFNIEDCFGLEIPEDSNWRIIPVMTTFGMPEGMGKLEHMMLNNEGIMFGVAKKSKYGECLVYVFFGEFYLGIQSKDHNYSRYDPKHFELTKIYCNGDNSNTACRCYIDGPDVINSSRLAVYFREGAPDWDKDTTDNWIYNFNLIDSYQSVEFKTMPVIGGINKNKHSLNEFNDKLEKFAKKVYDIGNPAYYKYKYLKTDAEFQKKCNSVHLTSQEVFDLWLSLYIENQTITFDDVIGMIRLSESKEKLILDYVKKCKCMTVEENWDGKYTISDNFYSVHAYHLSKLFGQRAYVKSSQFIGYLKDIEQTRKLYTSLDSYKSKVKLAKKDYRERFTIIAEEFEEDINKILSSIKDNLEASKNSYLQKTKELYDHIQTTYPGLSDSDVGIFNDITDILNPVEKSFITASVKLMRLLNPSYKSKSQTKKEKKDNSLEEFEQHVKLMFDVSPDLEKIIYYQTYKCYDAPYETGCRGADIVDNGIDDDTIYLYEEKYGQESYSEWLDKFIDLAPYCKDCSDADSLYPGQECNSYIDRNLEYNEEVTD